MKLTKRQNEIIALVKKGYKNDEIAALLKLKPATVKSTLCSAYARMGKVVKRI
jgi:DNA-binding NarL/FixJ family response regulator